MNGRVEHQNVHCSIVVVVVLLLLLLLGCGIADDGSSVGGLYSSKSPVAIGSYCTWPHSAGCRWWCTRVVENRI